MFHCSHLSQHCSETSGLPPQPAPPVRAMTDNEKGGSVEHSLVHYWAEDKKCWRELIRMLQSVGRLYSVCQLTCDKLLVTGGSVKGVKKTAGC